MRANAVVAVIDDDPQQRAVTRELLITAGFKTWEPSGPYQNLARAVTDVAGEASAAVCDQRLRPRNFAAFDGAELAAQLFVKRIPTVLVSQYIGREEYDMSIRRWRDKIPVVLDRDQATPAALKRGLEIVKEEIAHVVAPSRRPHRTLVRFESAEHRPDGDWAHLVVPGWRAEETVTVPVDVLPRGIRGRLRKGVHFFASVNLGAATAADLFFTDFEPAPDPDPNDGLT